MTAAAQARKERQGYGRPSDIHVSAETGAITIAGSPAVGDEVVLQIDRDAANGSDTLNASARLVGVRIFFTTDTGVDS